MIHALRAGTVRVAGCRLRARFRSWMRWRTGPLALTLLLGLPTAAISDPLDAPTLRIAALAHGITLEYETQGDPQGAVLVLLHGAGDSWHSFERVLPRLPRSYRVIVPTLRGHGGSDHPVAGYGRQDFARDVIALLDQLGVRHATLVGHSLGSFVAQDVALADGDRIDRLVLVGAASGPPSDPEIRNAIARDFSAVPDPTPYAFARDFQLGTVYAPAEPAFLETMVGEAAKVESRTWHALGRTLTDADSRHDPSALRIPTLIVWGDHDSIFRRADQDELQSRIRGSRLLVYPQTGHAVHWEQPERFARDLLEFLGDTGRPSGARRP